MSIIPLKTRKAAVNKHQIIRACLLLWWALKRVFVEDDSSWTVIFFLLQHCVYFRDLHKESWSSKSVMKHIKHITEFYLWELNIL